MSIRNKKAILWIALLAYEPIHRRSFAYSSIRKVKLPELPIGKDDFQIKEEKYSNLGLERAGIIRGLKSGKDHKASKSSKKSKKPEKHAKSYDENSHYGNFYPTPKAPAPYPTYGTRPARERVHDNEQLPYYDPNELSKYDSYSDMIDSYYMHHNGDSNSFDEPSPLPPAFAPAKRPFMDSPTWSYSEDEGNAEFPSMIPSDMPFQEPLMSPAPSMGQCMVQVGLEQCPSLLQTIEVKNDCDCYNFCGGIYLGCCAIGEPCPLACEVPDGLVAGCTFESTSTPITTSPTEGFVPTMKPSMNTDISQEPSLSATSSSTGSPTDMPATSETIEPSTALPTQVLPTSDDSTSMPTYDGIAISLEPFTLEYEITFSRPIAQSDLVVLASITNSYLQVYMSGSFQSDSINMADFVTEYTSFVEDPGSSVVLVTFKSTAFFNPSTQELPSRLDLERELATAFQGVALTGYLGRVQALPASNAFSTTSQIFMVQTPQVVSTVESKNLSTVATATAIFVVAIVTSLASLSWYRTRRRQRRLEASDNFLQNIARTDSLKEPYSRQYFDKDNPGSYRDAEKNVTKKKLLEDVENIEELRRGFEDYPDDVSSFMAPRDNISRHSGSESDATYLYEDDTIVDDEPSSLR